MKNVFKKGHELSRKPIIIRGVEYPSRKIASEVLGVAQSTITQAEKRGSLHSVGLRVMGRRLKSDW
jgi:hypothetical protein